MSKLGFIALAHPDYIADGAAARFADAAVLALRGQGAEVLHSGRLAASIADARAEALSAVAADVDGVILFLASWLECPVAMAAVTEAKHLPLFLWGFPMWEEKGREMSTGSYVSYAMFRGVLERIGQPFSEALGMPSDSDTVGRAAAFCRAASAAKRLGRAKIGLVGYTSMSIYTGTFDHVLLRWLIGPEVEQSDSYSLIRRAERFSDADCAAALEKLRGVAAIRPDISSAMLRKAMSLYLAVTELREQTALDAINVKCQYEFSKEYGMTMCVPLSLAASEDFVTSCEGGHTLHGVDADPAVPDRSGDGLRRRNKPPGRRAEALTLRVHALCAVLRRLRGAQFHGGRRFYRHPEQLHDEAGQGDARAAGRGCRDIPPAVLHRRGACVDKAPAGLHAGA